MDIKSYVASKSGSGKRDCPVIAVLAEGAGCTAETLYMIALGHKQPSGLLARSIQQASGGLIDPSTLRPDVFGPPPSSKEVA